MLDFENLGLSKATLKVIEKKGFEEPTPIQEKTIPAILTSNKDLVAQAQTGTGKTAAFGLPIIELLDEKIKSIQVLVLTPTRELAIQVAKEINSLKGKKKLSIVPVYGGQSINIQLRSLKKGNDIVVGTPGRLLDHIKRGSLSLGDISYLILDEADEMLNMGFIEEVKEIMEHVQQEKRTMLFSATMPKEIIQIAENYMGAYEFMKVTNDQLTVSQTDQIYIEVMESQKFEALSRIIDIEEEFYALVFCRTKIDVDRVANQLIERGYDADALHGDMPQNIRENILDKFRKKLINILVATDVASRGIDVQNLTHVINYNLPNNPESYVHRIGRTGRAGKEGNAITFITPEEYRKLQFIKRKARTEIRRAKLPRVEDIIETKKIRIKAELEDKLKSEAKTEYFEMASDLLKINNPENILANLLQYFLQDVLDEKSYSTIDDVINTSKNKIRLFVTQGQKDGLTRDKLIEFIREKCDIPNSKIRDIHILDKFSFITLPFHEAEILLSQFKKRKKKSKLFITKAKKPRNKS